MAHYRDISDIQYRVAELEKWIKKNAPECPVEQKHLDEGTRERAYWHYGYMVGLRDMLRFLTDAQHATEHNPLDKPSSYSVA
jgi:hypothetical protein